MDINYVVKSTDTVDVVIPYVVSSAVGKGYYIIVANLYLLHTFPNSDIKIILSSILHKTVFF